MKRSNKKSLNDASSDEDIEGEDLYDKSKKKGRPVKL